MKFKIVFLSLLTTIASLPVFSMEQFDIEAGLSKRFMKHVQHKINNVPIEQTIAAVKKECNAIDPDPTISQLATDAIHNCGLDPQDIHVLQMNDRGSMSHATRKNNQRFIL